MSPSMRTKKFTLTLVKKRNERKVNNDFVSNTNSNLGSYGGSVS